MQKPYLAMHRKRHLGVNDTYPCEKCDKVFAQKGTLKIHHQKHENTKDKFPCSECSKEFFLLGNLKSHMKIHSNDTTNECDVFHECEICQKQIKIQPGWETTLKNHTYYHNIQPEYIQCEICPKKIVKKYMNNHIQSHNRLKKLYHCNKCDYVSDYNGNLQKHMKIQH